MSIRAEIKGIQQAQRRNQRMIANLRPEGKVGRMIQLALTDLHRYEVSITHVDTGTLRAAHRMRMLGGRGEIFISPLAVNPRNKGRASVYGAVENERGGSHAFRDRTIDERGEYAVALAIAYMARGVFE
jgi:hypothetical protein